MEKILKSLVLENRRLIIPAIGAFLTKETDVANKKVTFSSFLKYDDGLLTKLLCDRKNISETEAKHEAANFAQRITDALSNGNNYSVAGFGYFTKDNNGVIDFVVENITLSENVMPKIDEPIITPPYVQNVVETPPVFGQQSHVEQNTDFDFSKIIIPSAPDIGVATRVQTEKKSKAGYWILAILLVIIATLLLLYLFSKDFKKSVNSLFASSKQNVEVVKTDTAKTATIDTVKAIQQDTDKEIEQKTTQPQQVSNTANTSVVNGKYQVILGCYLEPDIAENFANEMRNKGYNVRIPDRLAGEWTIVIAYESNDYNDATRVKDQFIAEGYTDAYIRTRAGAISYETVNSPSITQSSYESNTAINTTTAKRGRYQVIAGCYFERINAENFARELNSKGFNVTVPDRLYGEWTIVIVCESDDINEIHKVKNQCIAAGYDVWIRTR